MSSNPPRIASDGANYLPGQVLAGRYRMIGVIGRGGMGEVYRADDLKLGQSVALKFLAPELEGDPERLAAFLGEVRLSLRVSHPNVCRAYDIGEIDGRHFLSMEYVDGEDLASLLRRIGRLPEDKATEIARQICAGLTAAHDAGVLHRDLKPANIMIDGRGRAKITDFGLAGATAGISGSDAQAGTPQYMAPEQFDGAELTVRTDLYALGLVLYELFTGKPAFEGRNVLQLAAMRSATPSSPSTHVAGLDPVVERAILRCLNPDPARRPESAARLAASLPGGDPLAMAIAAGETPSPELVAQAGGIGELRPWMASSLLAVVLIGLGLVWLTNGGVSGLHNRIPLPRTPDELRFVAQSALAAAGYPARSGNSAVGFQYDTAYFRSAEQADSSLTRWDSLATVYPVPMSFWYRESPRPMRLPGIIGDITFNAPPHLEPGMLRVRLDPSGRLQEFGATPAQREETPGPWSEPDWSPMFVAAGLVSSAWMSAAPVWPSPGAGDVRRAWTNANMTIEAASFRGRITWFQVFPPWERPADVTRVAPTFGSRVGESIPPVFIIALIVVAAVLARRNSRRGRADWRAAARISIAYLCVAAVAEFMRVDNHPWRAAGVFFRNYYNQIVAGLMLFLFYLAVEPFVRRWWPDCLIAWSRLVDGRVRDPLVGRHILLGAIAGLAMALLSALPFVLTPPGFRDLGATAGFGDPTGGVLMAWTSGRAYATALLNVISTSIGPSLLALMLVLMARLLLRRAWLVYSALLFLQAMSAAFSESWLTTLCVTASAALSLVVLIRLGLVAFMVAMLFSGWQLLALSTNTQSWFFHQSVVTMLLFAGLATYGFWTSLGNQKLFRESVLS